MFRTNFITGNTVEIIFFGVTRTCLPKLNLSLKRFAITLNLLATKKTCIKRGKL